MLILVPQSVGLSQLQFIFRLNFWTVFKNVIMRSFIGVCGILQVPVMGIRTGPRGDGEDEDGGLDGSLSDQGEAERSCVAPMRV